MRVLVDLDNDDAVRDDRLRVRAGEVAGDAAVEDPSVLWEGALQELPPLPRSTVFSRRPGRKTRRARPASRPS